MRQKDELKRRIAELEEEAEEAAEVCGTTHMETLGKEMIRADTAENQLARAREVARESAETIKKIIDDDSTGMADFYELEDLLIKLRALAEGKDEK